MPKVILIKEYKRNDRSFPIGSLMNVTSSYAKELIDQDKAELYIEKKVKKSKKKAVKKVNKIEENGNS